MTLRAEVESVFKHVLYFNDTHIGYAIQDADGFYYYDPGTNKGLYSEYTLRMMANYLESVNAEWNQILTNRFALDTGFEEFNTEFDL